MRPVANRDSRDNPMARIVTTSWDDGDSHDLKVAELLSTRGMKGTFYVPIHYDSLLRLMTASELGCLISEEHEIGAHSVSHPNLTRLGKCGLQHEIGGCKDMLQQITATEVRMFCYPEGRYNRTIIDCVRGAGYLGARTVRMLCTDLNIPRFEMPTSLQAFPHTRLQYIRNSVKAAKLPTPVAMLLTSKNLGNWVQLGKRLFDLVLERGGVWHLFGHSWEVAEMGLWSELRELLNYVSNRKDVIYATNGDTVRMLSSPAAPVVTTSAQR
jgi:peptidoglycan/xylan/chitin deacetylase (PgdA/CDA1 family)